MSESWIKIYRRFEEWQWFQIPEMVQLFICLLINANPEAKKWKGITIERGQLVTSYESLHNKTDLSIRTLRTCLSRLEQTGEIERQATNKYSIITICNYDSYQCGDFENDKQETDERQTVASPPQPKKTKADIEAATKKRMSEFYNSLIPFVKTYGKEMVRAFYDYWSETNKSGSRMRFEQEKTWVLERRLDYWSKRDKSFNTKSNGIDSRRNNITTEQRTADAARNIASFILDDDD